MTGAAARGVQVRSSSRAACLSCGTMRCLMASISGSGLIAPQLSEIGVNEPPTLRASVDDLARFA
jgi:hypothetical protein